MKKLMFVLSTAIILCLGACKGNSESKEGDEKATYTITTVDVEAEISDAELKATKDFFSDKSFTVTLNDDEATISVAGNSPIVLKQVGDRKYSLSKNGEDVTLTISPEGEYATLSQTNFAGTLTLIGEVK